MVVNPPFSCHDNSTFYSHPEETPSFLNYGSIQNYARALRHRGNGENPRFRPPRENYGYTIF